jgi:hypothetical protein
MSKDGSPKKKKSQNRSVIDNEKLRTSEIPNGKGDRRSSHGDGLFHEIDA